VRVYIEAVIEARSTLHVALDVTAHQLQQQATTAHFVIVGNVAFNLVSYFTHQISTNQIDVVIMQQWRTRNYV